jgi:hypothetical protein
MPGSTAIDVAIGLAFVYVVLSLVCSIANETVASVLGWRAKFLREGLANLLTNPRIDERTARLDQVERDLRAFFRSPLVAPMVRHDAGFRRQKTSYPSYVPARTFVASMLEGARAAVGAQAKLGELVQRVPDGRVRDAFVEIAQRVGEDESRFQAHAEQWYDDTMERVSGWYKRRVQLAIWLWALALAIALNADTIRIARTLWTDKAVRAAVVQQAQNPVSSDDRFGAVARSVGRLDAVKVPMGWTEANSPHSLWQGFSKALGILITAAALSLGAPFWFDVLSKVARLRGSGAPPPATDAVRRGEGEETRKGPQVR